MEQSPSISVLYGPGKKEHLTSALNGPAVEFVSEREIECPDQPSPFLPTNILSEESTLPTSPAGDGQSLSPEEDEEMFRSIQAVFWEAVEGERTFDVKELLASLELADEEARRGCQNVQTLKVMRGTLDIMWKRRSDYLARAAEALADGCRDPTWREPYGQTGILDFFLQIIATDDVHDDVLLHSLRLIGNSCADTNENRKRVVDQNYTLPIIKLFRNPAVMHVAIPVIYNICVDFEPAQAQVAANGISYSLLTLLVDGAITGNALLTYTYELVEIASEQAQGVEQSPDDTLSLIVKLGADPHISCVHFAPLINSLAAYLQNGRFQHVCIITKLVGGVLWLLQQSYEIETADSSAEDSQALAQLRLRINQSLSDISALPLFPNVYPLTSPLTDTLLPWLGQTKDQLQICACVMLGNLARQDEICQAMVNDLKIHLPLISILNSDAKGSVLHAALGFLKNLAIAGDNREHLGEAGIIKVVSRLWAFDSLPQVQFSATSLTRQVIISSFDNISRLLEPLSSDPDSPASCRTYLSLLLSLFTKTDSTPIKTEIGRIIGSICRTIGSLIHKGNKLSEDAEALSERLFSLHEDVARPVNQMIIQTEWPVMQSEGWFALALMASTKSGSVVVAECLLSMSFFQLLSETVRVPTFDPLEGEEMQGKTERSKKAKDRDNAIILVRNLLRNSPPTLPQPRQAMLQDLMHEVGEMTPE